jgi:hypothetical protein
MSELVESFSGDERFDGMIFADGYDEAFVGLGWRFNNGPVAVYDREKVMEIIMEDGCSFEEAQEYFEFNIIGGWVGEFTPIFMVRVDTAKIQDQGLYF